MSGDYFKPGAYNVLCDRTGYKFKSTQVSKEWTGNTVNNRSWEARHPLDFIRSFRDDQAVPDANPEPADYFLSDNEVTADDL